MAAENLFREGVSKERVHITGNTVVDALKMMVEPEYQLCSGWTAAVGFRSSGRGRKCAPAGKLGLAFEKSALGGRSRAELAVDFVFSMHSNPRIQAVVKQHLNGLSNVHLIDNCGYKDFINLLSRCSFIVTDSEVCRKRGRPWADR